MNVQTVQRGAKNGTIFVRLYFTKNFTVRIRRKFVIILSLKIPPHLKCVVTEWGKLSQRFTDHAIGQWRRRLKYVVQQQGEHIAVKTAACDSYFGQ